MELTLVVTGHDFSGKSGQLAGVINNPKVAIGPKYGYFRSSKGLIYEVFSTLWTF